MNNVFLDITKNLRKFRKKLIFCFAMLRIVIFIEFVV